MKKKSLIKLIAVLVSAAGALAVLSASLDRSIELAAETEMKNECERIVSESISEATALTPGLLSVLETQKDSAGMITMASVNSVILNEFTSALTECVQKRLGGTDTAAIGIPLGNVLLSRFFSGEGPLIEIKVFPNSSCAVEYSSDFRYTGINQSMFTLYATVKTESKIRVGIFSYAVETERKAAVCNIIIVGNVPQTYANLLDGGDFLNLVP